MSFMMSMEKKISEEEDIARIFTEFFQNLFTSSEPSRFDEAVNVVQGRVTEPAFLPRRGFCCFKIYETYSNSRP
jgi:hypothetical protein